MKAFVTAFILVVFLAGGTVAYLLISSTKTVVSTKSINIPPINSACTALRKEERRIIDQYMFLLSREEIRLEEDRRKIALEFHDKISAVVQESEKKDCPIG